MIGLLLITAGLSLHLVLYNGFVWAIGRQPRIYLWTALWSLASLAYQMARYRQITGEAAALFLADRLCLSTAVVALLLLVLIMREVTATRGHRWLPFVLAGAAAVVVVLTWTTPLFITPVIAEYRSFSGHLVAFSMVGPLYAPFLLPTSLAALAYGFTIVSRSDLPRPERIAWYGAMLFYQALGGNDLLLFSGATPWLFAFGGQSLFEFGIVGLALGLSLRSAHRTEALQVELEARTLELGVALKEAHAAAKAKTVFLANVSHEVRTPLNGIMGLGELLQDGELPPVARERLDLLVASSRTLSQIINDILDFSKLEACRVELVARPVRFRRLLEDVRSAFEHQAKQKGIELVLDAGELPEVVSGDELRLRQIINNLVANAIKFTDHGSVTLTAQATRLDASHASVHIAVADTGLGIAPEHQARLFRPFTQVASAYERPTAGGTGLGLAISRQLVTLMGGAIALESTPGVGSRFFFDVPLAIVSWAATPRADRAASPRTPAFLGRILLAEDNATNRMVALGMLKSLGLSADAVVDGLRAVEAVTRGGYDLVLMDCQMPELDGIEATRELRRLGQVSVPVIALTAFASEEDRCRCLEAGMNDFLTKPLKRADLADVLERFLRRKTRTGDLVNGSGVGTVCARTKSSDIPTPSSDVERPARAPSNAAGPGDPQPG